MDKNAKSPKVQPQNNHSFYRFVFIAVIILVAAYFIYLSFFDNRKENEYRLGTDKTERFKDIQEPQFKKEGELEFLKKDRKTVISKIPYREKFTAKKFLAVATIRHFYEEINIGKFWY